MLVHRGFEHLSGQTNDYKIDICCFSAKHGTIKRRKDKVWLVWMRDNLSKSGSTCLPMDCCCSTYIFCSFDIYYHLLFNQSFYCYIFFYNQSLLFKNKQPIVSVKMYLSIDRYCIYIFSYN